MTAAETPVTFRSGRNDLFGVAHLPSELTDTGILILVGGPQYRVGSHRMFVEMARELSRGYPVFRFDFTGMGDSEGVFPGFEKLDGDIAAALRQFGLSCPAVRRFVLLGLCDGATAAAYYAPTDERVCAVALLNPWVHTQRGEAKTFLWYYYPRRLLQRDAWRSLFRGEVALRESVVDFFRKVARAAFRAPSADADAAGDFVDRMRTALGAFRGRALVATSERDHTALQFSDLWTTDVRWRGIRESARCVALPGADHTLSARKDMQKFCGMVGEWLRTELPSPSGP